MVKSLLILFAFFKSVSTLAQNIPMYVEVKADSIINLLDNGNRSYSTNGFVMTYLRDCSLFIIDKYQGGNTFKYTFQVKNNKLSKTFVISENFFFGNLKYRSFFKNGIQDSVSFSFYSNGSIRSKETIKNGDISGPYQEFYITGKVRKEGYYSNGFSDGKEIQYWEDGKIFRIRNYKILKIDTGYLDTFIASDGVKLISRRFYKSVPEGDWFTYDKNSELATHVIYKEGILVRRVKVNFIIGNEY